MPKPSVGEIAPDFTAAATGGREVTLSTLRGQPVVLVFYPGDATPVCTAQLKNYTNGIQQFADLDAVVLGLSPQSVESHENFAADEKLAVPLLVDENKQIGQEYGVLGPLGFYRRSVFVIDRNGFITYAKRNINNASYVRTEHLVGVVKAAQ